MSAPARPGEPTNRALSLDMLAARVGAELADLARTSAEVQTALSLCHFADHTDPSAIRGLQGIDRITQSLEDLGRLMVAMSEELPAHVPIGAERMLSRLRLHELQLRFDPGAGAAPRHAQQAAPGDITWL